MTPDQMATLHAAAMQHGTPWSAKAFADALLHPGTVLVFENSGFALGRHIDSEAELLTIAVAPTAQRTGMGRRLLCAFEDAARDAGAKDVFLEVAHANTAARNLYAYAKYEETGRRRSYYRYVDGRSDDALILRKSLNI